jgi:SAM-dependent methyltransferase
MKNKKEWWQEEAGFFGKFYMEGDSSVEGYLSEKRQTLFERTWKEVEGVIRLLKIKKGDKILDFPCGYGRHSIELAKKGFRVVAADINCKHLHVLTEMVSEQKKRHDMSGLIIENADMRKLQHGYGFNAVINMFYSFGFFETDQENEQVLKNFYNTLRPGGKFLMHTDVNIPRILSGEYKTNEVRKLTSGKRLTIRDVYNPKTKRIEGSWTIEDKSKKYSVRVYTKKEFIGMCLKIGFKTVKVYSDWMGTPYSSKAEDMIIVASK